MQDSEIPTSEPVKMRDGTVRYGVKIKKGQFFLSAWVHGTSLPRGAGFHTSITPYTLRMPEMDFALRAFTTLLARGSYSKIARQA